MEKPSLKAGFWLALGLWACLASCSHTLKPRQLPNLPHSSSLDFLGEFPLEAVGGNHFADARAYWINTVQAAGRVQEVREWLERLQVTEMIAVSEDTSMWRFELDGHTVVSAVSALTRTGTLTDFFLDDAAGTKTRAAQASMSRDGLETVQSWIFTEDTHILWLMHTVSSGTATTWAFSQNQDEGEPAIREGVAWSQSQGEGLSGGRYVLSPADTVWFCWDDFRSDTVCR